MGSAFTAVDKAAVEETKKIDAMLARQSVERRSIVKILLLGPSEVGKSTILKQMKILHCNGFTAAEYEVHKWTILKELVRALIVVTQAFLDLEKEFSNAEKSAAFARLLDEYRRIENLTAGEFESDLFVPIKSVLTQQELLDFLKEFERTNNEEATFYFLKNADRICAADYLPTPNDMLNLRIQTTGVVETCFTVKNVCFKVIDVAGQKALRRKWIHCFDDARAVMFLCALSDYNMFMKEDQTTNRMTDALQLCGAIFNSKWFAKSSLILFLNKKDMFEQKLKTIPLNKYFVDYTGDNSYEDAVLYFERKFSEICGQGGKHIYKHRTCATDTNQMKLVIDNCIDMIITANISTSGIA